MPDIIETDDIYNLIERNLIAGHEEQPNGYQLQDVNSFSMNPVVGRGYGIKMDEIKEDGAIVSTYYNFGPFRPLGELNSVDLYDFTDYRVSGDCLSALVDGGLGNEFYSYDIPIGGSRSRSRSRSRNRRRHGSSPPRRSRRAAAKGGRRRHRTRRHKKN